MCTLLKSDLEVPVSAPVCSTKLDLPLYPHFPSIPWPPNTCLYILCHKRMGVLIFPFARLTLSPKDKAYEEGTAWLCQVVGKT